MWVGMQVITEYCYTYNLRINENYSLKEPLGIFY